MLTDSLFGRLRVLGIVNTLNVVRLLCVFRLFEPVCSVMLYQFKSECSGNSFYAQEKKMSNSNKISLYKLNKKRKV